MFERILVPTDGSGPANAALEYAGEIAATERAIVHVLHAIDPDADPADAADPLADGHDWVGDTDAPVIEEIHTGEPADAILEYAAENSVDAIVMGTHGRRGVDRLLHGSVTESVVRDADVPVLSVRGAQEVRRRYPIETVVAPIDGSEHADVALERALSVARHHDATLHLLSVVDVDPDEVEGENDLRLERLESDSREILEDGVSRAEAASVDVASAIRRGSIAEEIRDYADDADADLLVMGTQGRSGLDRLLVGSVTEDVLRTARAPVLTVRATEAE